MRQTPNATIIASAKNIGKNILKGLLWFLVFILGLVLLIVIALQFPAVQNYTAHKAADYLSGMLETKVEIGKFRTDWRNSMVLEDVYIEDLQQDTLWYSQRLGADIAIWSLLSGEVNVSKLDLEHATVKLHIRPDSTSNFDFLIEAFPTDTTAAPMQFNLGIINLVDVNLRFRDEAGGNYIATHVGNLTTSMDELNLETQRYMVDNIELRDTWIDYVQTKLPPETEPEPLAFNFGLNEALFANVKVNFVSHPSNQSIKLNVGESELKVDEIDLPNAKIDLKSFALHNTTLAYAQDKNISSDSLAVNPAETVRELDESVEKTKGRPVNWVVTLGEIDITNVDAAIDNFNTPKQPRGMDFNHLAFKNVMLQAQDLYYSQKRIALDLNQLALQEKSGFRIDTFQAEIIVDSTRARLADLYLNTGNSLLIKEAGITYPSLTAAMENPELISLAIDVEDSYIGMQDLLYFAPDLADNPSFRKIANSTIQLELAAEGPMENIRVRQLHASGLKGTVINVRGNIRNITDPNKLYLDLKIPRISTTRTDVLALVPKEMLPPDIRIPGNLTLNGSYQGSLTAFDAQANIRSSFGNIIADIDMDEGPAGAEPFTADIRSENFDLGQFLKGDYGLGKVSFTATAKGKGIAPENMEAVINADVQKLSYNNYTYKDLNAIVNINKNIYDVKLTSKDENIAFDLDGTFNLRGKEPNYDFNLNLQGVNLQALNLYPEDLRIQGNLKTNLSGSDLSTISGTIDGRNLTIVHNGEQYPIDSLLLAIDQTEKGMALNVRSDVMTGTFSSKNDLATLPTALQKHFSNYFDLQPDPPFPANLNLEDFAFDFNIKKSGLITSFVPGLEIFVPGDTLKGSYNSDNQQLVMNATVKRIKYMTYDLHGLNLKIDGDRNKLAYNIRLNQVEDSTILVKNVSLQGEARDNEITTRLAVAGDGGKERFVLGGLFNSLGTGYRFKIDPDQLVINGDKWSVPADNSIQFDTDLLYARNVKLERNGSYISLNSTGPVTPNAPMNVEFKDFDLGYVMETVQREDSLMAGVLNGTATLREIMSGNPSFTSDLNVEDFAYMGNPVGDISLDASTISPGRYNLDIGLTDNGNMVKISGIYEMQDTTSLLNLTADINTINMKSLESFMQGALTNLDGSASGDLKITGTLAEPDIRGKLDFTNAAFTVPMLGARYRLNDDKLLFDEEGVKFNNITLSDSANNDALVNGAIYTDNYVDYRFDLDVKTDRFLAINSTANDNSLYYGTAWIKANAKVTGTMVEPIVNADVTMLEGSDLTYVVPVAEAGAAERAGIVEFIDVSDTLNTILKKGLAEATAQSGFKGMDLDATITVTDKTEFTILIDAVSGDHLNVRGNGTFITGVRPTGEIDLSGRYDVTEGMYKLSFYNLVTREFEIQPESFIVWNGDPLDADVDMVAIYRTKAAPLELVATEVGGLEQAEQNRFRTQLPFEVLIDLEGDLFQPTIDFDIQLPEDERAAFNGQVEAKLQQLRTDEAEQNKQVFALIVLGRFLAPDPLQSSGGGLQATARNSVSQVLSDQLNKLTDKYAGGLGLELGVNSYEDYSTGSAEGRTDLNVALRQQLLNDRLVVRVGTDIGLEGTRQEQSSMSNFGGDVSIEYLLTSDGRLRVRAFRNTEYEGFLEGDVLETGAALIYQRDYNNFSDLFRSLEKRQKRREEELEKSKL